MLTPQNCGLSVSDGWAGFAKQSHIERRKLHIRLADLVERNGLQIAGFGLFMESPAATAVTRGCEGRTRFTRPAATIRT